jgi:hypothetical protein
MTVTELQAPGEVAPRLPDGQVAAHGASTSALL